MPPRALSKVGVFCADGKSKFKIRPTTGFPEMAFGGLIWRFSLACGRNPPPVSPQCMTFEGRVPSLTLALCAPE